MVKERNRGAFHIARQIYDSEIWTTKPAAWTKIWIYILGHVNWKDNSTYQRGEGFFRFSHIYHEIGIDITLDMVKKCLAFLRKNEMISTSRSTRGTKLKVLNYNEFQDLNQYFSTSPSTSSALQRHFRSTPILEEGNKVIKEYSDNIKTVVENFYSLKSKKHPRAIKVTDKLIYDSCDTIDKLNRIDEVPLNYIREVVMRSITDDFWKDQIMSLVGLRKKKDGVDKFTKLANAVMRSDYTPEPTHKVIGHLYECPSCGTTQSTRQLYDQESAYPLRCNEPYCQVEKLLNGKTVGYVMKYKEKILKEIS